MDDAESFGIEGKKSHSAGTAVRRNTAGKDSTGNTPFIRKRKFQDNKTTSVERESEGEGNLIKFGEIQVFFFSSRTIKREFTQ